MSVSNVKDLITIVRKGRLSEEAGVIGDYASRTITEVTSDNLVGITEIPDLAFDGCTNLTSITIPDSVTYIGRHAFYNCSNLTSITIPDSVTSIGAGAFINNTDSIKVFITDLNKWCAIKFGSQSSNPLYPAYPSHGCLYVDGKQPSGNIVISNIATSIPECTFSGCTNLTSITIPDSVTSIGYDAFYGCYALKSITFGENSQLITIDGYAFRDCSSLTSITIPDSVTSIGYDAFSCCTNLTSITIPDSVTSIGCGAFDLTQWYKNQPDGVIYVGKVLYEYKGTMPINTSINIKDGIVTISDYAFSVDSYKDCTNLTSITIPDSVTSIGYDAFYGCYALKSITFGENSQLITIDGYAFRDCSSLTSITIPDSVTSIGNYAFSCCTNLKSITFGENSQLTTINRYAFHNCSSLTSITIPDSVTYIGEKVFNGCSNLTTVIINATTPPTLSIWGTFSGESSLEKIIVPKGCGDAYKSAQYWSQHASIIVEADE